MIGTTRSKGPADSLRADRFGAELTGRVSVRVFKLCAADAPDAGEGALLQERPRPAGGAGLRHQAPQPQQTRRTGHVPPITSSVQTQTEPNRSLVRLHCFLSFFIL